MLNDECTEPICCQSASECTKPRIKISRNLILVALSPHRREERGKRKEGREQGMKGKGEGSCKGGERNKEGGEGIVAVTANTLICRRWRRGLNKHETPRCNDVTDRGRTDGPLSNSVCVSGSTSLLFSISICLLRAGNLTSNQSHVMKWKLSHSFASQ